MSNTWELNHINSNSLNFDKEHKYENELSIEPLVCNQYNTGRCWIFASLNCMRHQIIKHYGLNLDFEFSANYLFFWDKYERCKFFLTHFPTLTPNDEMYNYLLHRPITDAGQWHMFVNLVDKYGVVPQKTHRETYSSNSSLQLNQLLNNKLKTNILKQLSTEDTLNEIYNLLVKYLGNPPLHFQWNDEILTPKTFYIKYVKPYYNVHNYVNLINDPRHIYNTFFTVENITNMPHTKGPVYYNIDMNTLIDYAKKSIMLDEAVWFSCDMSKFSSRTFCVNGPTFYKDSVNDELTKKERLIMLDSGVQHAMVLHGFSHDKWKIQNSWGKRGVNNGYYISDNIWIKEYVYQMIIPKKVAKTIPTQTTNPKKLPLFDPFGILPTFI